MANIDPNFIQIRSVFFILTSYVQKKAARQNWETSRHFFWRQGANSIRNQAILGDEQRDLVKTSSLMSDICDRDEPPNFLRVGRSRNRYIRQFVVQSRLNGFKQ